MRVFQALCSSPRRGLPLLCLALMFSSIAGYMAATVTPEGSVHGSLLQTTTTRATPASALATFVGPSCKVFVPSRFPSLREQVTDQRPAQKRNKSTGGDWSPCAHLKEYGPNVGVNFATFLARLLAFHVKPRTSLEFGCGLGLMSDFLARFAPDGCSAICVEPSTMLHEVFGRRTWPNGPGQIAMNIFDPDAQQCAVHLETRGTRTCTQQHLYIRTRTHNLKQTQKDTDRHTIAHTQTHTNIYTHARTKRNTQASTWSLPSKSQSTFRSSITRASLISSSAARVSCFFSRRPGQASKARATFPRARKMTISRNLPNEV